MAVYIGYKFNDYILICRAETLLGPPTASSHEVRNEVTTPVVKAYSWMHETYFSDWQLQPIMRASSMGHLLPFNHRTFGPITRREARVLGLYERL